MEVSKLILQDQIQNRIYTLRKQKIILDYDIAKLYGVEVKRLNEQAKRNFERFPSDFMFRLTDKEFTNLKSQIATSSYGGRRTNPYAFTEQGVAMLSSVLKSKKAIKVNITIMRVFTKLRELIANNEELLNLIRKLDHKYEDHSQKIEQLIGYLNILLDNFDERKRKNNLGFKYNKLKN